MSHSGWHPAIESACVLSLSRVLGHPPIFHKGLRLGTLTWTNGYGETVYSADYRTELHESWGQLHLTDDTGACSISLGTTPLHFGGRRWWMYCPITGQRALKLYRYEAIGRFCHRTAIRPLPTYASQRVSGLDRIQQRRWAIRRKLGDPDTLLEPLNKPKWMRWRTFERYQSLDDLLAEQEVAAFVVRFGQLGILD